MANQVASHRHVRGGSIIISHIPNTGTTTRCLCCDEVIQAGQAIQATTGLYHPKCFICNNCGLEIPPGIPFVEAGESFAAPYHPKCYQEWNQERCAKCKQPITVGKTVIFDDVRYHKQCLVCAGCYGTLADNATSVSGRPYCGLCAHKHVGGTTTTFSVPVEGPKPDHQTSIGANSQLYSLSTGTTAPKRSSTISTSTSTSSTSSTTTSSTIQTNFRSSLINTSTSTPTSTSTSTSTPLVTSTVAKPTSGKKFCTECGANVVGRNFCVECGTKV